MAHAQDAPTFRSSVNYRDHRAALDWLEKAFGFEINFVVIDNNDEIVHAEMRFGNGLISVAQEWSDIARSPKSCDGRNTQQIHVQLESGIEAHCERSRAAGAIITQELADQFYGDRTYRCLDPEGHLWTFGQTLKELSFAQMEKASGLKLREKL